ncbi:S9 family peptidase [Curtobacterium ammoniigenes]|uniref:S9 family peptidase n=1 Tax=Curtobacterium ammoniigenes TaxID=395387 RepID=UPI000830B292|nr:prolyl oligopeptidase family serine peptidase [Curtobacterium ammoniigenes]
MTPFSSLDAYIRVPRITGLALSADGARLVATVQEPDAKLAKYVTALWELDPTGRSEPRRITHSEEGEQAPAFEPDGSLLFISARPDPRAADDAKEAGLWRLPRTGEPTCIATLPGGISGPVVTPSGVTVVSGSQLVGSTDIADDAARRKARADRGITAILHDGMPIRFWDHELGDTETHLYVIGADGPRDITPDVAQQLRNPDFDVAGDGSFALARLSRRGRRGTTHGVIARIELADARTTVLVDRPGAHASHPRIAPDGRHAIVGFFRPGSYDTPHQDWLEIVPLKSGAHSAARDVSDVSLSSDRSEAAGTGPAVRVELGDLDWTDAIWSADGETVFVTGDLHGRGAVVAVDPRTGDILRTIADDAVYSHPIAHPDGSVLFALRTAMDSPATPVRIDLSNGGKAAAEAEADPVRIDTIPAPGRIDTLPGTVRRVAATLDGVDVPGWLVLPESADRAASTDGAPAPASATVPVMVWVHGGPFSSWNAWSWRWNPWLAVERGYAVLLPDPALSTGYGQEVIDRAWPHRADVVWHEIEGLLDSVLDDPSLPLDRDRVALLGASFGGYMTNWIAGHTDRFRCIVTHAGLWSLDQQHDTTDAAENKNAIFGTEAEHPDWYAANSPDRTAHRITTPMLLVHGNRDYRVPISEALRAWWDLVSGFDGEPAHMPHRFLQLTGENHWVMTPSNARVWNETVFAFCDQHTLGGAPLTNRIGITEAPGD